MNGAQWLQQYPGLAEGIAQQSGITAADVTPDLVDTYISTLNNMPDGGPDLADRTLTSLAYPDYGNLAAVPGGTDLAGAQAGMTQYGQDPNSVQMINGVPYAPRSQLKNIADVTNAPSDFAQGFLNGPGSVFLPALLASGMTLAGAAGGRFTNAMD